MSSESFQDSTYGSSFSKAFTAYAEMRNRIKAPLTKLERKRIMAELKKYPVKDWVPLLEQSTRNKWRDIYPLEERRK